MGGVGRLVCQGLLVRETCVSVLVCGIGFLLSGVQWSVQSLLVLRWVYVLGETLGSLYVHTQVYVPALLKSLGGMSCSGAYWLLGGGWFWCRYGGFLDGLLFLNVPCSQEFSGFLRFWA